MFVGSVIVKILSSKRGIVKGEERKRGKNRQEEEKQLKQVMLNED